MYNPYNKLVIPLSIISASIGHTEHSTIALTEIFLGTLKIKSPVKSSKKIVLANKR